MKRSAGITAFAVLFILGNIFALLGGVMAGLLLHSPIFSAASPATQQSLTRAIEEMASPLGVLSLLLTVVGLISAFALLKLRAWARWTTMALAGCSVILQFITIMTPHPEMQDLAVKALSPYVHAFMLFWYGLIIWYFLRPSVTAQFQKSV